MNTPNSTGEAWDKLEEKVDGFVEALIKEKNFPGMTVAVTKQGRLLLSKGYGSALVDGTRKLPMKPCSRSGIGSVTKAVVTAPAAFQLMELHKIDPKLTNLYGAKGFFGGIFDADIDIGIKKYGSNSPSTTIKEPNAPNSTQWKEWYENITIQDLLDHTSGFASSGDQTGAAEMFDVSIDELTYEQIHRHFLRTQILQQPGTERYSNHGMGLLTVLIQKLSGKSYSDYVREDYLKPMKLHNAVQPERVNPDSCDASEYKFNGNGKLSVVPFKDHYLGLAAGGFMASAESLLKITNSLVKKYKTAEEIDSMGWLK